MSVDGYRNNSCINNKNSNNETDNHGINNNCNSKHNDNNTDSSCIYDNNTNDSCVSDNKVTSIANTTPPQPRTLSTPSLPSPCLLCAFFGTLAV